MLMVDSDAVDHPAPAMEVPFWSRRQRRHCQRMDIRKCEPVTDSEALVHHLDERLRIVSDDRTYPSLLERGLRTPTFFVIISLAEGLNMDPVVLFTDAVGRLRGDVPF
jgi:hypothetical protein